MAYFCINLFIKDPQELAAAQAEGYIGASTKRDIIWNGPLAKGDFMELEGVLAELEIIKLVHYFAGTVGSFGDQFTDIHLETSKEVVDSLLANFDEVWERLTH